jgi:hypothetical protein
VGRERGTHLSDVTSKQNIKEHIEELDVAMGKFGYDIALDFINDFEEEALKLSEKLTGPTLGRAMYHIGFIVGFADGREQTVAELFDELDLP